MTKRSRTPNLKMISKEASMEEAHRKSCAGQFKKRFEARLPSSLAGPQTFAHPQNCHIKLLASERSRSSEYSIVLFLAGCGKLDRCKARGAGSNGLNVATDRAADAIAAEYLPPYLTWPRTPLPSRGRFYSQSMVRAEGGCPSTPDTRRHQRTPNPRNRPAG